MNPIHQCFQKISPGNHFSYVRDRTYGTYVRTDKGDAICPPPPIINGGGIKTFKTKVANTKCRLFATIFNCVLRDSHGLMSCLLFENHASETQDAQVKKSLKVNILHFKFKFCKC